MVSGDLILCVALSTVAVAAEIFLHCTSSSYSTGLDIPTLHLLGFDLGGCCVIIGSQYIGQSACSASGFGPLYTAVMMSPSSSAHRYAHH